MDTEEIIFQRKIPVNKIMVQADSDKASDEKIRNNFISVLKENGWDDEYSKKIKDQYLSLCFIFHIGSKRKNLDLDNIIKFYIDAIFQAAYPGEKAQNRPDWKVSKIIAQKNISDKYNENNEIIELKISINNGTVIDC